MMLARWEKAGILVLVATCALLRGRLPAKIELGEAVLLGAVVLLVQGLVRDVARVRLATRERKRQRRQVTCVCAESTLGATVIVIGTLLLFATSPIVLTLPRVFWSLGLGLVMSFGFATRHLVLDWGTRRLRWEPDHSGVLVWRRR